MMLGRYFDRMLNDSAPTQIQLYYKNMLVREIELHPRDLIQLAIPMSQVSREPNKCILFKPGGPPCFYELSFRCARKPEHAIAVSRNFEVTRTLHPVYNVDELSVYLCLSLSSVSNVFLQCDSISGRRSSVQSETELVGGCQSARTQSLDEIPCCSLRSVSLTVTTWHAFIVSHLYLCSAVSPHALSSWIRV